MPSAATLQRLSGAADLAARRGGHPRERLPERHRKGMLHTLTRGQSANGSVGQTIADHRKLLPGCERRLSRRYETIAVREEPCAARH